MDRCNVKELRTACARLSLPVSGNRDALVARLEADLAKSGVDTLQVPMANLPQAKALELDGFSLVLELRSAFACLCPFWLQARLSTAPPAPPSRSGPGAGSARLTARSSGKRRRRDSLSGSEDEDGLGASSGSLSDPTGSDHDGSGSESESGDDYGR